MRNLNGSHGRARIASAIIVAISVSRFSAPASAQTLRYRVIESDSLGGDGERIRPVVIQPGSAGAAIRLTIEKPDRSDLDLYVFDSGPHASASPPRMLCSSEGTRASENCRATGRPGDTLWVRVASAGGTGLSPYRLSVADLSPPVFQHSTLTPEDATSIPVGMLAADSFYFDAASGAVTSHLYRFANDRRLDSLVANIFPMIATTQLNVAFYHPDGTLIRLDSLVGPRRLTVPGDSAVFLLVQPLGEDAVFRRARYSVGLSPQPLARPLAVRRGVGVLTGTGNEWLTLRVPAGLAVTFGIEGSNLLMAIDSATPVPDRVVQLVTVPDVDRTVMRIATPFERFGHLYAPITSPLSVSVRIQVGSDGSPSISPWRATLKATDAEGAALVDVPLDNAEPWAATWASAPEQRGGSLRLTDVKTYRLPAPLWSSGDTTQAPRFAARLTEGGDAFGLLVSDEDGRVVAGGRPGVQWRWPNDGSALYLTVLAGTGTPEPSNPAVRFKIDLDTPFRIHRN